MLPGDKTWTISSEDSKILLLRITFLAPFDERLLNKQIHISSIKINIHFVTVYSEIIVIYILCHIFTVLPTHAEYANNVKLPKTYNFELQPQA